tara:strand:+ start:228 stop:536 length:309 start_codon:yes stop_codon:yes gene_type:complete
MAFRRYENSKTHTKLNRRGVENNKLYNISAYKTVNYSFIPKSDNDIYVITQDGDRLDLLANQFYGDVNLWWYIAKANGLKFMTISPGTSLRIPGTTDYAIGV